MSTGLAEFDFTKDEPEFMIVYNNAWVSIGVKDADSVVAMNLHPNSAIKLLLELREALKDLHDLS